MRNLQFPSGSDEGRRPRNDDFVALQELVFASEKIYKQLGEAFVVEGCEVSGSSPSNDISAGIIFIDGKLRSFEGATGVDLSVSQYLISDNDVILSPRPLFTGGVFDALTDKRARLSLTPASSPAQSLEIGEGASAKSFYNLLYGDSEWQGLNLVNTGTRTYLNIVNTIQFKKDVEGRVLFRGCLDYNGFSGSSQREDMILSARMPIGYIPKTPFSVYMDDGNNFYYNIYFNRSGVVADNNELNISGSMTSLGVAFGSITLSFFSYIAEG